MRPPALRWRALPVQVGCKLGKPNWNRKNRRKCTGQHGTAAGLSPALSEGSVKLSALFTSATLASWGISLLRKPCWHVTSKPKKTHYTVSCNALYKKDHARSNFCLGSFGMLRSQSVCLRSTLFRCWIAGCGKILLMWVPLSSAEDPSNGQHMFLQHTQHSLTFQPHGTDAAPRSISAQELRTSRRFIAVLLNINTSMGIKHCSQHTDFACLILHTNAWRKEENCIQFLVQNTKVEKKTCYCRKGRNSPSQFAGLVMQDAATLRPITTCISVALKWQDHTSCVFHALHQYDTAVTVYFHRTEGKYSFYNTSGPWT